MKLHIAYDDVSIGLIPKDAQIVLAYIDGSFANVAAARAAFPHARILTITVAGNTAADFCDCEPGAMTVPQAALWAKRRLALGKIPGLYTSVSQMPVLLAELQKVGISRKQVVLWSAHYTGSEHLCGPHGCRFPGFEFDADGTQFTNRAAGRSLDESVGTDRFLTAGDPIVKPKPPNRRGKARAVLTYDLAADRWSVVHIPGFRVRFSRPKVQASVEVQLDVSSGLWRVRRLPDDSKPLGR